MGKKVKDKVTYFHNTLPPFLSRKNVKKTYIFRVAFFYTLRSLMTTTKFKIFKC